jgi:glycerol kinase
MSGYILAIDQGTTSTRAIVFDKSMRPVGTGQKEFTQIFPQSGWVEHDPEEIWKTVLFSVKAALKKAALDAQQITAIGITNQRETVVVWDKATAKN